jgi:hypothetical protein
MPVLLYVLSDSENLSEMANLISSPSARLNRISELIRFSAQYTAAAKTSALDSTAKALDTLGAVFKKDPKLNVVLHAPMLTVSDKQQIVAELAKHIGGVDKGDIVKNFLNTLADNNRLGVLEAVTDKFAVLMGAARGEVELTVTSAAVSLIRAGGTRNRGCIWATR